jgi:hypothetical protein
MWRRIVKTRIVVLLWLFLAAPMFGETFLVVVQEYRGGDRQELPLASMEGLMSAMFDLGHITFETGLYRPRMSWDDLQFAEPLRLAREGGAGYLAVVRVFGEPRLPASAPEGSETEAPELSQREFSARAEYLLLNARTSTLLGRGELTVSSTDAKRELSYDEVLFLTGEKVAAALAGLCGAAPER